MGNISIQYCTEHEVFQLHFDIGYFFLCTHQLTHVLHSAYEQEPKIFMQAHVCALNDFDIDYHSDATPEFQLCFGKILICLHQKELLFFLSLLWKNFESMMKSIVSQCSEAPPAQLLLL